MANTALGGFRFAYMRGGSNHPSIEVHPVANNYGTGIFRGDVLTRVSDGTVAVCGAGTTTIFGVANGVVQYSSGGVLRKGTYLPASTTFSPTTVGSPNESKVEVILATPDTVFEVDCNTSGTDAATARGYVGNNCDHAVGSGGSTTTGRSSHVLDTSSPGTGTAGWRVIGISPRLEGNSVAAVNWKALVVVNESMEPEYSATGV